VTGALTRCFKLDNAVLRALFTHFVWGRNVADSVLKMLNGNLLMNLVIWTVIVLSVVKSLSNANMLENIGMNFLEPLIGPLFFPGFATLPFTLFYSFAFLYHTLN